MCEKISGFGGLEIDLRCLKISRHNTRMPDDEQTLADEAKGLRVSLLDDFQTIDMLMGHRK